MRRVEKSKAVITMGEINIGGIRGRGRPKRRVLVAIEDDTRTDDVS